MHRREGGRSELEGGRERELVERRVLLVIVVVVVVLVVIVGVFNDCGGEV